MKKKNFIWIIAILIVVAIVVFFLNDGSNLLSSVISRGASQGISCTDSDGGANYSVFGRLHAVLSNNTPAVDIADVCSGSSLLIEQTCNTNGQTLAIFKSIPHQCSQWCANGMCRNCTNPEWVLACSLGLATCDSLCMLPAGYGYGYGWGGQGTGYWYGYGYKSIDFKSRQPYMYLINVFKTYSKSVYDAAVNKLGGFKMVKSYNTKEFKDTTSTR